MQLLEYNKDVLYALIMDAVSKIVKSKLSGKAGYTTADEEKDALWLLETLGDIVVNFKEVQPKILAIDDQMGRVMWLTQGESTTNEDFPKTVMKELKVYKKHHGCNFLWGKVQYDTIGEKIKNVMSVQQLFNLTALPDNKIKDLNIITSVTQTKKKQ